MGRRLVVFRHSKSSWKNPQIKDHDRPLNKRGMNDLVVMAKKLKEICPDLKNGYISTSNRTCLTAEGIQGEFGPNLKMQKDRALYLPNRQELLRFIQSLPDEETQVLLVGHQPSLSEFVDEFGKQSLGHIPTSGFVVLDYDCESWKLVSAKKCLNQSLFAPKSLEANL